MLPRGICLGAAHSPSQKNATAVEVSPQPAIEHLSRTIGVARSQKSGKQNRCEIVVFWV